MLLVFEICATVAGLTEGTLLMLNRRIGWVFYIIEVIFTLLFSFFSKLYGDVANNVVCLIIGIASLILWNPKIIDKISSCKPKGILCYVSISVFGSLVLYFILKNTGDQLPMLDAITTTTGFVADYLMMTKKIDAWYVWLFNDVVYCFEYLMLPNQAFYFFALNIIWTILAVISLINWGKDIKKEESCEKDLLCREV